MPSPSLPASPRRIGAALAGAALLAGGSGAGVAAADGPSGPTGPASTPTGTPPPSAGPAPIAPRRGPVRPNRGSQTTTGRVPGPSPAGCAAADAAGGARPRGAPTSGHCAPNPPAPSAPAAVPPSSTPAPVPAPALSPLASAAAALVPNFFIDNYRIPAFLLPIYHAAGIEYGVPWQVLAAINEVETDYGRNLSVSSAGAEGWMQFLPPSWQAYGVDAALTGRRDPYDPADAVFATARFLHAAGASLDLHRAIFAFNHAEWYVASVLARARLIQGTPNELTAALAGLAQGRFPVSGPVRYPRIARSDGASSRPQTSVAITGPRGSAVVAAQDGVITAMGSDGARGRYLVLEDGSGNRFVYEQLGDLAGSYPVLRDARAHSATVEAAKLPVDASPTAPATAGDHALVPVARSPAPRAASRVAPPRERLFANPQRPRAQAAGGRAQIAATRAARTGGARRLAGSADVGVPLDGMELRPVGPGAHVLAGTVLGQTGATPMHFAVRPAGIHTPRVDPRPLLDGWRLLAATGLYRVAAAGRSTGERLGLGQILLAGQAELERRVLANPRIGLSPCGRAAVATGEVDRRVLGTLEFLTSSGLAPTVRSLPCPPSIVPAARPGLAAHPTDDTIDITAVNRIPIAGHQGVRSITDVTIRRLLTLQGALKPKQIVSLMSYPRTDETLSLPGYARRVRIAYRPQALVGSPTLAAALSPTQWRRLAERLASLSEPDLASRRPGVPALGAVAGGLPGGH